MCPPERFVKEGHAEKNTEYRHEKGEGVRPVERGVFERREPEVIRKSRPEDTEAEQRGNEGRRPLHACGIFRNARRSHV